MYTRAAENAILVERMEPYNNPNVANAVAEFKQYWNTAARRASGSVADNPFLTAYLNASMANK
jgi:hypothetical protein